MTKLLQIKKRFNYTQEQKNAIVAITINTKNVVEFGSFALKLHEYFNDIDLFEVVTICCSKKELAKKMADHIFAIVANLPKNYIFQNSKQD